MASKANHRKPAGAPCAGFTKSGKPCGGYAITGSKFCTTHEPSRKEAQALARRKGGIARQERAKIEQVQRSAAHYRNVTTPEEGLWTLNDELNLVLQAPPSFTRAKTVKMLLDGIAVYQELLLVSRRVLEIEAKVLR